MEGVRLAEERKINLYPSEKRQMPDYRVFEDFPAMNVLEPYEPGDKPSGSFYVYNSRVETSPWISLFREKTDQKEPVTENFQDYFIFLTDKEIGELKKWSYEKGLDVNNIDLGSCKEFWKEYTK